MLRRMFALLTVFAITVAVSAQKTPSSTGAPSIDPVSPMGGQTGSVVDVAIGGSNLAHPLAVLIADWARVTIDPNPITGKDSTKIPARIEVPVNAPIGMHRIRLATAGGISNSRAFCVDALPQILELDTNHSPAAAQAVAVPCVIVGRVDAETSDYFKFTVAEGQRFSFEVLGRRLGSNLDPILRLHDARTGRELPRGYSDDAPGLQSDPRLTYTFAASGEYLVEIRDTMHRGGKDFWYRLRIGDFPCAVTPMPLAVKRGSKVLVGFAGTQVEGVAPVEVDAPVDSAIEAINVTPIAGNGLPGWPVSLLLSDHDEHMAGPTIGSMPQAQRLTLPCGVTGRFLNKSQKDHFVIAVKKGQRFVIDAQTSELNSPAEVYISVRDGAGAELARTDPNREAHIDFTAPADGDFFIVAEHLNYSFGPSETYRLVVAQPTPGFDLALSTDRIDVPQGQPALIPISTLVRRDYGGPIEISVVGPQGLTGSVTVPPGVQALPAAMGQPSPSPAAFLPIHAAIDLPPGAYEVKVVAKAMVDRKELIAFASTKSAVQAQMAGLPNPPRTWLRSVAVGVTPKPPYALSSRWERPEAVRGLAATLFVAVTRDPGFEGDIVLNATGLPSGVTAASKTIVAGKTEVALEFKLTDKAGLGTFAFSIIGKAKQESRDYAATLLPAPMVIALPFELAVEPNPLPIDQGGKATLKIAATRKGGYTGPIGLELRNLPTQVTNSKAAIEANQVSTTMTLTAATGAPLGSRGDVDVLGTVIMGNQQAASPTFTIRVQPPPPQLSAKVEPISVTIKPGEKVKVKVTVERMHFAGLVAVTLEGLPNKVAVQPASIAADKSEAEIEIVAAVDADAAETDATLTAKGAATATTKLRITIVK